MVMLPNPSPTTHRLEPCADPQARPASILWVQVAGHESLSSERRRNKALEQVSWVITYTVRSSDAVYRVGDSGFCVVMTRTPESDAMKAAERLRGNVECMPLLADVGVTVSVGVAVGSEQDLMGSIKRAEESTLGAEPGNQVLRAIPPID